MPNLWLVGMMGTGKTSVGRVLAERHGMEFVDTDARVASRLGCSIGELWGRRGEGAFRDMEAAQVAELSDKDGLVIATGGGVVLRADNTLAMRRSGSVVWLTASPPVLASRLTGSTGRPLLNDVDPEKTLGDLIAERQGLYQSASHAEVDTEGLTAEEVAAAVEGVWNGSP